MAHIDRIAALLAQAERTDNPLEAEAYLAKAQMLATASSIDLARARARTARREAREQPTVRTITIGEPGRRANTHLVSLFVAVGHCNDVQIDVARNSTYVICFGMPSDLDLVETLFGSLAFQMASAAAQWLTAGDWRDDHYVTRQGLVRPHTAQTARAAFYRGFIERISARLRQARDEAVRQADHASEAHAELADAAERPAVDPPASIGAELVLRRKAEEVRSFYRTQSTARGSWSGYSGAVSRQGGVASRAGREAATRARLSSPSAIGGVAGGLPRSAPPGAG